MFTMALVGRAVTDWAGAPDAVVEYGVRFTRPVSVPDDDEGTEIVVSGVVKEVTEDGLTRLDLTATCGGEKVLAQARAPDPATSRDAAGADGLRRTGWESRAVTRTLVAPWGK